MTTTATPLVFTGDQEVPTLPLNEARQICDRIRHLAARLHEQLTHAAETGEELTHCIELAYVQRAWEEMGYASWEALCKAEFSQARLWDTIENRRNTAFTLLQNVGMSARAIAAVLGVSHTQVNRDIATVAGGTYVPPATDTSSPTLASSSASAPDHITTPSQTRQPSQSRIGRDGKTYSNSTRQRPVGQELVDRRLLVAQKRAEGKTQAEIAAELDLTQRTVSNDTQAIAQYKQKLDSAQQQRLDEGRLSRTELTELVGLTPISSTQRAIVSAARSAAKGLSADVEFLTESVVFNDSWLGAEAECSSILAPSLISTIHAFAHWLGHEFRWDDVPEDKRMEYHDHLIEAVKALSSATGNLVPED